MESFLNKLSSKVKKTPEGKLMETWNSFCQCTLQNSHQSLLNAHECIKIMLQEITSAVGNGKIDSITTCLTDHQIPAKMVAFAEADNPHDLINEVIYFFTEISKRPLSVLLLQQSVIRPLNKLIESAQPSDPAKFFTLIETLTNHVTIVPNDIELFIQSETSAPLIHQIAQLVVSKYQVMGDVIIQLMESAKSRPQLLTFITVYSPLIATCIEFIRECVSTKTTDSGKQQFLASLDLALEIAPKEFMEAFMKSFTNSIIMHQIVNAEPTDSLRSAIYLLSFFENHTFTATIAELLKDNLPQQIESDNEELSFLALRFSSLLLEHFRIKLPKAPENAKITLNFMSLLKSEWFVQADFNRQIQEARSRVSMSLGRYQTVLKNAQELDIEKIAASALRVLRNLLQNSARINAAVTEFLTGVASVWTADADFFALCEQNTDGLYKVLSEICADISLRIGTKPGVPAAIQTAYSQLEKKESTGDETEEFYQRVVIALEFVKEIHATAQSKNLIAQSEANFEM